MLMVPYRVIFVHEGVGALNEVCLQVVLKRSRSSKMGKIGGKDGF